MLSIAEVVEATGAPRADVIRVIRGGGTTQADWHIACAIERLGGRRAADLMWGPERIPTETPTPTNPDAKRIAGVRIYEEPTAPDAPQTALPDYPVREEPLTGREAAEELAASVQADLGEVLEDDDAAARLTAAWSTPAEGRRVLARVVPLALLTPRGRVRLWNAEYAAADAA
ncbi:MULTISPECIES: hypothetical protein [Nocardiopsis]|uniref:XRE family transcriptional regulator n=1 Tax=Nocardiopsis changdeensis TaxID=2831969 RepID=A0ABX8BYV1_9ACTN|nr:MULTISPECIES: hypothetical protein [Nocardiopsis]QUX26369.1 hypothetical protein KGD84_32225 [Nocardiopsis changdeensis]QYX40811.1 hypothetical protein K1J57_32950 [Nocardiopsis sp. MT53]